MNLDQAEANCKSARALHLAAYRNLKAARKIKFEILTAGLLPPKKSKRTSKAA